MAINGKALKYGDNVDTDVIIPARYMNTTNPQELAAHCFEDLDPDFAKRFTRGGVVAAGKNFGCGSSREHAPIAIKASGVALIIAESFARIFYRNAINIGLPIIEHPQAAREIADNDQITMDFATGKIINHTQNREYDAPPFPEFVQKIIARGGLVNFVANQ